MTISTAYSGVNPPQKVQKKEKSALGWVDAVALGAGAGMATDAYLNNTKRAPKKYLEKIKSAQRDPSLPEESKIKLQEVAARLRNVIDNHKPEWFKRIVWFSNNDTAIEKGRAALRPLSPHPPMFEFTLNGNKIPSVKEEDISTKNLKPKTKETLDYLIKEANKNNIIEKSGIISSNKWALIGTGTTAIIYLGYKLLNKPKTQDKH